MLDKQVEKSKMLPIPVNGPMLGIFLKELVRRAVEEIRRQRFLFEATQKQGYDGDMNDIFTSADTAAQAIFSDAIQEALPGVGMIGEEGLYIPSQLDGCEAYVTIDPLDGTRAFVRRQSHGVSTMVAFVMNGEIISAWIGDVNTQEIFGYRPDSRKVHRISELRAAEDMAKVSRFASPEGHYILLRDAPEKSAGLVSDTISEFEKYHVDGSSIGTWFARLWKGEYAALMVDPGFETPWDSTPFIGISQKLGFVFLRPSSVFWEEYIPVISTEVYERKHYTLVVHSSMAGYFTRVQ